jgi:hypothetical protein
LTNPVLLSWNEVWADERSVQPLAPSTQIPDFRSRFPDPQTGPPQPRNTPTVTATTWPAEFTGPMYYYSTDLSPIEVTLRSPTDHDPSHKIILHIPRAAIVFANGYDPAQTRQLPNAVVTDQVRLALTAPTGEPLSVAGVNIATAQHLDLAAAIKGLRSQVYASNLYYTKSNQEWERLTREAWSLRYKFIDEYEGMAHAIGELYAGEDGVDQFLQIRCDMHPAPTYFCKMDLRIASNLGARVDFFDFRFHGGPGLFSSDQVMG